MKDLEAAYTELMERHTAGEISTPDLLRELKRRIDDMLARGEGRPMGGLGSDSADEGIALEDLQNEEDEA